MGNIRRIRGRNRGRRSRCQPVHVACNWTNTKRNAVRTPSEIQMSQRIRNNHKVQDNNGWIRTYEYWSIRSCTANGGAKPLVGFLVNLLTRCVVVAYFETVKITDDWRFIWESSSKSLGSTGDNRGNGRVNTIHVGLLLLCRTKTLLHCTFWLLTLGPSINSRFDLMTISLQSMANIYNCFWVRDGVAWYKSLFLPPEQNSVSFLLVDLDWIDIPYHCNYLIVRRDGKRSGTNQRMNESMINAKIEK